MTITANAPGNTNCSGFTSYTGQYIEAIKHAINGDQTSVDWIVVSHNDGEMLRRVGQVTGPESSVILKVPQPEWDFQSDELSSALDWSINKGGAKHLLLVGHSDGASDDPIPSDSVYGDPYGDPRTSDGQPTSVNRLFGGAREVLRRTQKAKEQYAEKVDLIFQNESVRQAIISGSLRLHTLFYLAHSDSFMIYELSKSEFRPLA